MSKNKKTCSYCGSRLCAEAKFCRHCGRPCEEVQEQKEEQEGKILCVLRQKDGKLYTILCLLWHKVG